jgi:hypothetical protein
MKRRNFIRIVGASALGLPFVSSQFKPSRWKSAGAPVWDGERTLMSLALTPAEQEVLSVLRKRSGEVCLVGGGVLAKAAGEELSYINLLADSKEFTALKKDLFAFGVQPISTPETPSTFIKFLHGGKPYTVMNMDLEDFVDSNRLDKQLRLLPLAHNFLVYFTGKQTVLDPYDALGSRGRETQFRMKRLQDPANAVAGLELCLAVAFDSVLLGLEAPVGHAAFERRLLAQQVRDAKQATVLFHEVLSFFPDLVELRGWDFTRKYLASPLCVSAAAKGPGIDLLNVERSLGELSQKTEISSKDLLLAINGQFRNKGEASGVGLGLPDYFATNKLPIRRSDLMAEVVRSTTATVA